MNDIEQRARELDEKLDRLLAIVDPDPQTLREIDETKKMFRKCLKALRTYAVAAMSHRSGGKFDLFTKER